MPSRPNALVVIAGTGTDIGKTWVAAALISELRSRGVSCAARKPAQSYDPRDRTTDSAQLSAATGEDPAVVCPPGRSYEVAMAPPMSADSLGRPRIALADLIRDTLGSWGADPAKVGVVELAGGVRSPLAHDGDGVDMIAALAPDLLVVVADAGLGTINAVMATLDSLGTSAPATTTVLHLNRYDDSIELHRRNLDWLSSHAGASLTTDPVELATHVAESLRGRAS